MKRPTRNRVYAVAGAIVAVVLVATGFLLFTNHPRTDAAPSKNSAAQQSAPASAFSSADVAFLKQSIDSPNQSVEAKALAQGWEFAPGSPTILTPGTTITIRANSFQHVGDYGLVTATADNQTYTLYLEFASGRWLIYDVVNGIPANTTSQVVQQFVSPVTAPDLRKVAVGTLSQLG